MSTHYYAVLGSHPILSELELRSILSEAPVMVSKFIAKISLTDDDAAKQLQNQLGGTVKILKEITTVSKTELTTPEAIQEKMVAVLQTIHKQTQAEGEQLQFCVTSLIPNYSFHETHIKKALQTLNIRARFRDSSVPYGTSAAVLLNHPVVEVFGFVDASADASEEKNNQKTHSYVFAQTIAWQDIDVWTFHDRSRPFADRKRGMLPLKVARMLVNIGTKGNYADHYLYDPFCGTGSILQEAFHLGVKAIGSDLSPEAIVGTQKNLSWYQTQVLGQLQDIHAVPQVFVADVTKATLQNLKAKPTVIVTEPFLGKQQASLQDLPNVYKGLYKLYKGALSTWKSLLEQDGEVVIIFPSVTTPKTEYDLSPLIDELPELGYNIVSGPIVYARPDAHTKRNLYILRKI